jgi:hypothetical protein
MLILSDYPERLAGLAPVGPPGLLREVRSTVALRRRVADAAIERVGHPLG